MSLDADRLRARPSSSDHRCILDRCGFELDGKQGSDLSGVLGPKELGEGDESTFSVDLEEGLVKDWGSSRYKGDVFSVVQDVYGLNFPEALEWIVEELNLDASTLQREPVNGTSSSDSTAEPKTEDTGRASSESVVSPEQVQRWNERLTGETEAANAARSYLIDERGIAEDVLQAARLGLAYSPTDHRATWWIMIPVPDRVGDDPYEIAAVKGFAFNPETHDWKRTEQGRKIPRNAGTATLYDLVPSDPMDGPVLVCEGELDALCALSNGFNAVTGTAGANTFHPEWASYVASLSPAQEDGVVLAFDGDEAGTVGEEKALQNFRDKTVDVQVASLPEGQDINDVLLRGGPEALQKYLNDASTTDSGSFGAAVTEEQTGDSGDSTSEYEPFPLDPLPNPVRAYVRASAKALGEGIPPAMVAVPTLSVLSGAIGDAARIQLKRSWTEPATLWTMLVAPSGSTKSPAFSHAVRPIFRRESEARDEHEEALRRWKAQDDPDEQEKPTRRRYRTGDATPEAVVKILEENPRGVLLARDELGAWIGSFDRYVNGAADLQFWVEVWEGTQASRDRAGDGNTTVDTPAVPVTGTIQPGTLKEKLDEIHFDTGFAARLILCQPPPAPKRWTEADVSRRVRDAYEQMLAELYNIPRGTEFTLSPEAKEIWIEYYNNANAALETRTDGPAKAVAAKGVTHTARLALILHLCHEAGGTTDTKEVAAVSMEDALQVGQWFTDETLRVYRAHKIDESAKPPTRRFLKRLPDQFETADARQIAEEDEIPRRTLFDWLERLQNSGDLEKKRRGHYHKC